MQDRRTGSQGFRRIDDGVGIDAVVAIELANRAGLAEMLDAERLHPVTADAAEPAERGRMTVDHGDDAAVARQRRQQFFDMAQMLHAAAVTSERPRRGPTGMQPVQRGDGKEANVPAALTDET